MEKLNEFKKKKDLIIIDGVVTENLSNMKFRVKLDNDAFIIASVSGKIRLSYIRIFPGDRVRIEISPYDLTNGRITFRYK